MKKFLKVFFAIMAVIVILLAIHTIRNFTIITNLEKRVKPYADSNNYYFKSVHKENSNTITTVKYYEKEKKQLVMQEKNVDGVISKDASYNNGEKITSYYDTPEGKIVKFDMPSNIYADITSYFEGYDNYNTFARLITSMKLKIEKTECNGKTCYAISSPFGELSLNGTEYIEKETGLCLKIIIDEQIIEKEYEFDNVSDEIFVEPDISQYRVDEDT